MLARLHSPSPHTSQFTAVLLRYDDPKYRNEFNTPPASDIAQIARSLHIGVCAIPVAAFEIGRENPFPIKKGALGVIVLESQELVLKSAVSRYHDLSVDLRPFENCNRDLYQHSIQQGPVRKIPFFDYSKGPNGAKRKFSITWTKWQDILSIPMGTASKIWLGSLVIQHAAPTFLALHRALSIAILGSSAPSLSESISAPSLPDHDPYPSAQLPSPVTPNDMLWIWYPEYRPSSIVSYMSHLSSLSFSADEATHFHNILPLWSGFYRAHVRKIETKKSSATATITYDDNPDDPMSATAYLDDSAQSTLPEKMAPMQKIRTRLYTSLPISTLDNCTGYEAWGFEGMSSMSWAFILPYVKQSVTPLPYGPVRSIPASPKAKKKSSKEFKPLECGSGSKNHELMSRILLDAKTCESGLIDMVKFFTICPSPSDLEAMQDMLPHSDESSEEEGNVIPRRSAGQKQAHHEPIPESQPPSHPKSPLAPRKGMEKPTDSFRLRPKSPENSDYESQDDIGASDDPASLKRQNIVKTEKTGTKRKDESSPRRNEPSKKSK